MSGLSSDADDDEVEPVLHSSDVSLLGSSVKKKKSIAIVIKIALLIKFDKSSI